MQKDCICAAGNVCWPPLQGPERHLVLWCTVPFWNHWLVSLSFDLWPTCGFCCSMYITFLELKLLTLTHRMSCNSVPSHHALKAYRKPHKTIIQTNGCKIFCKVIIVVILLVSTTLMHRCFPSYSEMGEVIFRPAMTMGHGMLRAVTVSLFPT